MKIPFSPPPGLNSDDTTFAAEGRWASCSNVRFWNGKPQVVGGWDERGIFLTGVPRKILEWSTATTTYIGYGTSSRLYVETGGAAFNISPVGLPAGGGWSLQSYGDTLMANQSGGKLYQWTNNTAVVAAEILAAPDKITAMLVTPERQVLALGCNEEVSGTFNPLCIRGCDIEDPTDWTTTATNNAFEHILEGEGSIIGARLIGGYVMVWTTTAVYVGQFIGDPGQTYRFDRVGSNCGAIGLDSMVVVEGAAYWVGRDLQFYSLTPGSPPQILPCPIQRLFQASMNTSSKASSPARTHAAYVAKYNEVWFFYPVGSSSSANPTSHVGVSLIDGSWFIGTLGSGRSVFYQGLNGVYGASSDGSIFNHETGATGTTTTGEDLQWSITSADQYLGKAQSNLMVRGFEPDFKDLTGTVSLNLLVRQYPNATAVSKGPYSFTTTTTKKDFRVSARIFQVKFSGDDALATTGTFMRLGEPLFDAVPTGQR